jgi:hypothetical protein
LVGGILNVVELIQMVQGKQIRVRHIDLGLQVVREGRERQMELARMYRHELVD